MNILRNLKEKKWDAPKNFTMVHRAKINNMLVSGNMTPKKMGRKVEKKFYFKKKICPIFYFMTHLFPTAQLKNRGVEAQGHNFFISFFIYMFYWIK